MRPKSHFFSALFPDLIIMKLRLDRQTTAVRPPAWPTHSRNSCSARESESGCPITTGQRALASKTPKTPKSTGISAVLDLVFHFYVCAFMDCSLARRATGPGVRDRPVPANPSVTAPLRRTRTAPSARAVLAAQQKWAAALAARFDSEVDRSVAAKARSEPHPK